MNQSLPANFLWGNSVSSMQTEGAWNEGGKGMSVYDIREPKEFASDWKVATDSYHRFEEQELINAILSLGSAITVIAPPEFKVKIHHIYQQSYQQFCD